MFRKVFCFCFQSIKVTFVREEDGVELTAYGRVGDTLLDVVVDNEVDLDGFGKWKIVPNSTTTNLNLNFFSVLQELAKEPCPVPLVI